jgi:hypothetical protein
MRWQDAMGEDLTDAAKKVARARGSVPREADGEYLRGWHAGVEAAKRVVEGFITRGRRTSVRTRQEAAPAILGQLERLSEPMEK